MQSTLRPSHIYICTNVLCEKQIHSVTCVTLTSLCIIQFVTHMPKHCIKLGEELATQRYTDNNVVTEKLLQS
jgi:hypothetical protein